MDKLPRGRRSEWVPFPVKEHAWAVGAAPVGARARGNPSMFLLHLCLSPFLSPSLPLSLKSINMSSGEDKELTVDTYT